MPDLLVHALFAYVLCVLLSRRRRWLSPAFVSVGMVGAFLPDISKAAHLLSSWEVRQLLGIPFSWGVFHTGAGVLLSALLLGTFVPSTQRRRVIGLLVLGAGSHLVADAMLITATGRTVPFLWPLIRIAPPTPGLYTSTDPRLTAAALAIAALVAPLAGYRHADAS